MNSSAPTALFVLGVTLVFVFCTIIYPMPLLYAALFTVGAGLSLYLFKDVPLKLLGVKQRRKEELSAGNTAPQLDSATSNLPVMTVGRQQVTVPPVTYPPYQRTVPTFARAEAQRTEQVRNPRENNDPAHLAGMGMSTADEALRERLIKILSAIPIPHALNLEKLHALGMWEYPTIQELLQRASKSLDKVAEYVLSWAGIYAPRQDASTHILYSGQTGGGKTTILKHLMIQVLFHVGYGRNQRAVVYDPKNDMLSFLYAFVPKKAIKVLNPLDARCVAWDMAKDIVKPTEAQTLAAILIPKEKDDKPFFPLAAQMIVHGVITSFICTTEERRREGKPLPVQWTLRHLCWAIKRKEIAKAILSKHELTKDYMRFLDRENADVELTAQSYLLTLEAVAAAWDGREKISLLDWIEDTKGQILVLGSSAENKEAITALNTLIVERLNQIVLSQPDIEPDSKSDPRLTSFFLDEFADLKMPSLVELLKQGRSKGARVALTFQSYNSIKKNYGEEDASVIADNCLSQVFLYSIGDSAKWISENIGKERKLEVSYGKNKSDAKGTSTGTSRTSGQASSHTSTHGSSHTYTSGYGGAIRQIPHRTQRQIQHLTQHRTQRQIQHQAARLILILMAHRYKYKYRSEM